jgi:SAM-dependent methyltransferase
MEAINRRTWRSDEALHWFRQLEGFIDPAEQVCFERLRSEITGARVLDLGVGAGRTTRHFLGMAADYVGIDYTPEMVAACRAKHPRAQILEGDARDLSRFADGTFDLVSFSFNGIDAVDLEGRRRVLAEVHRVLRPGGAFFFSTMNRDGPDFRSGRPTGRHAGSTSNPIRLAGRWLRIAWGWTRGLVRRWLHRRHEEVSGEHAILLHAAHDSGILVYATTFSELLQQVEQAGFLPPEVLSPRTGAALRLEQLREEPYFQLIARRAPAAPA